MLVPESLPMEMFLSDYLLELARGLHL